MEAIIFDVDGTLWDSVDVVAKAWKIAIKENSDFDTEITRERLESLFGKPVNEIFDILFPTATAEEKLLLGHKLEEKEAEMVSVKGACIIYPNVIDTIEKLSKKYKLFLVSNCQSGYIDCLYKVTDVNKYIIDQTCFGDTGLLKHENILKIMRENNISSAVYVGDTITDYNACKLANIPMIFASYGFGNVEDASYTISDFSELLSIDFDKLKK